MTTVSVSPTNKNPSHFISLEPAGGTPKFGLLPVGQAAGVQEIPYTPSTVKFTEGGGKYSDFQLPYSHIAQIDWSGGRGQAEFNDETKFYDSYCAWTTRPGIVLPGPQWCFGAGYKNLDSNLWNAKNMNWLGLYGTNRFQSYYKNATTLSYAGAKEGFWIKRVGTPGTLTAAVYSDAGTPGTPNAALATGTVTVSTVTDIASLFYRFAVAQAMTDTTLYWFVLYGAASDTATDHWEVGGQTVSASALYKKSSDGTTWANGTHAMYFTYTPADTQSTWGFYRHKEASYAYLNPAADSAPTLYCIGDRGVADASTSTTLVDATKTWTVDRYIGSTVLIFNGTGKFQSRPITDNDATSVTVSPAWGVTPDNTSEYVILGDWHLTTSSIGTHGLAKPITDVADAGSTVYFAMGDKQKVSQNTVSQAANAFSTAWTAASDNVFADILHAVSDSTNMKLWRVINTGGSTTVSNATAKLTAIAIADFTAAGTLGPFEKPTGIIDYDGKVWVLTHKNAYYVINNIVTKLGLGIDSVPSWHNGVALASHLNFLYFSWSHSFERFYGSTLDDVGPWEDAGLPAGRTGAVTCFAPVVGWLIYSVDGGDSGTSSVMVWNGRGHHEIWRAWETGKRINALYWEPIPDARGRLWVGVGDDLVYMDFPLNTLNPANDLTFPYNHESHIVTSWTDANYAELAKYVKELSVRADGLGGNTTIAIDYQTDDATDASAWTNAGSAAASPQATVTVNVGDKKRVRFRVRLLTSVFTSPAKLVADVLKCFARTPVKYQWNVTFHIGHKQRTYTAKQDHDPNTLLTQLKTWCTSATPLTMHSVLDSMDNKTVIIEPPGTLLKMMNTINHWFKGTSTIVIRET